MRLDKSIARLGLATAFIVAAFSLRHSEASVQTDMSGMPGMTPTATPSPAPAADSNTSPTPTPTPAASAAGQKDMESMPGMAPADSPAKKDMSGMPGMGGSETKGMGAMRGMGGSEKKGMAMPGMSGGTSAPQRMAAPGVFVLGPPQKWTPPPGDDRRGELMSREELKRHMNPLPAPVEASMFHSFSLFDLLEYRYNSSGPDQFVWDFVGWYGGNYNRLWVKTEGRQALSQGRRGEGDLQLLYGRLIAPFWDFQIGARAITNLGNGSLRRNARTYAVIGFQGLAPGNFDVEPAMYISDHGEISGELTVSADVSLTQRLILQPRFQGEVSAQDDKRFGTGSGVTQTDIGLRLRYEIRREFAPYIGVSWLRKYGSTASIARAGGEPDDAVALVTGLRLWW